MAVSLKIYPDQPIRNVAEVLPEVYSEPEYEACKVYGAHEHGLHIRTAGSSSALSTRKYNLPESGGTTEIFRFRFCAEAKPALSWLAGLDDLSVDIIILAGFTFSPF